MHTTEAQLRYIAVDFFNHGNKTIYLYQVTNKVNWSYPLWNQRKKKEIGGDNNNFLLLEQRLVNITPISVLKLADDCDPVVETQIQDSHGAGSKKVVAW